MARGGRGMARSGRGMLLGARRGAAATEEAGATSVRGNAAVVVTAGANERPAKRGASSESVWPGPPVASVAGSRERQPLSEEKGQQRVIGKIGGGGGGGRGVEEEGWKEGGGRGRGGDGVGGQLLSMLGSKRWSTLCIGGMGTAFLFLVQDKSEDAAAGERILHSSPLLSHASVPRPCHPSSPHFRCLVCFRCFRHSPPAASDHHLLHRLCTDGGVSEWKGSQRVEGDHQWLQQLQDDGEHTRGSVLSDDHATLLSSLTPPRMSSPPPCSDRCTHGRQWLQQPQDDGCKHTSTSTRGGRNESNLEHGQQQGAAWGKGLAQEKQSSIEQHTGVAWCGRQSGRAAKRQTEERGTCQGVRAGGT
ncbi:unnamed protein product [Closterium sp. NIES-64]|nr:unnamed protein product [Closterium sp. NIES-64]